MRIVLVEVSEKGSGGEVLQARSVVSHDIVFARQVADDGAVAVGSLMEAGQAAEVGAGGQRRGGTFAEALDGRCVVAEELDSRVAHGLRVCEEEELR